MKRRTGWQGSLNSRGAQSITHLASLFRQLAWWKLVPDQGSLLKSDAGAFAARDREGSFAVIYLDTPSVAIDLDSLAAGEKTLRWYDPSNGIYIEPIERLGRSGLRNVTVPASANAFGFQDWIAVLSTQE
nr:putative collagen-binding domain-containing protein [Rhizobium sp. 28DA2]